MRSMTSIKGLSEVRRLPRLGKIRLGIRVATEKGRTKDCLHPQDSFCFRCSYPKEVPYFVLPPEARAVYGDQPTEIDIMFPVDDPAVIFPQAYKAYGSDQGLKCKGDGESALRRLADVSDPAYQLLMEQSGQQPNDLVEIPCPCPLLESGKCGPKGCLMVMLPRVSCGGVYQIDTGSQGNLIEINSALEFLQGLLGRISMVELKLRRVAQEIQHPDLRTGKVTKSTHYLLKLIFEGSLERVLQLRAGQLSIPAYTIPAPVESGPEPTGECPVEIAGEVVDPGTGEILTPQAKTNNGKISAAHRQIVALVRAEGINSSEFLQFLANQGILDPRRDGSFHLQDLPEIEATQVIEKWTQVLEFFRGLPPPEAPPQFTTPAPVDDLPSAEKLARAEALVPHIVLGEIADTFVVPSATIEGKAYLVGIGPGGGWVCQCDGYGYRSLSETFYQCSHIMAARMAAPSLAEKKATEM